jgi:hypothetical protein
MKYRLIALPFVISFLYILNSCTTTPCFTGSFNFGLKGFTQAEADTILVRRFFRGSNFNNLADSFLLTPGYRIQQDTLEITSLSIPDSYMNAAYDYQLVFPGIPKTIRLTEITEVNREIKHSVFNNVKVGCENSITGMNADGVPLQSAGFNNFYFSR